MGKSIQARNLGVVGFSYFPDPAGEGHSFTISADAQALKLFWLLNRTIAPRDMNLIHSFGRKRCSSKN